METEKIYGKDENWRAIRVRCATSNSTHQVAASTKFQATRSGSHHLHLMDRYFSCICFTYSLVNGLIPFHILLCGGPLSCGCGQIWKSHREYLTSHFYPNFWVSGYEPGLEGLLGMMILIGRGKNGAFVLNSSPLIGRTAKCSTPHNRDPVLKNSFICLFSVHKIISVSHQKYDFLTAIWLSHRQLWAILKGTASLTQC